MNGEEVAALRKVEDNRVLSPLGPIVLRQLCAQPARLDADYRVGARIERISTIEGLDTDRVFLQILAVTMNRPLDEISKKPAEAVRSAKAREASTLSS